MEQSAPKTNMQIVNTRPLAGYFIKTWGKFFGFALVGLLALVFSFFFQENSLKAALSKTDVVIGLSEKQKDVKQRVSEVAQAGAHFLKTDDVDFLSREFLRHFADGFTFDPSVREERAKKTILSFMQDALYFSLLADSKAVEAKLQKIRELGSPYFGDPGFQMFFTKQTKSLLPFPSGHPFAAVYDFLEQTAFDFPQTKGLGDELLAVFDARAKKIFDDMVSKKDATEAAVALLAWKNSAEKLSSFVEKPKIEKSFGAHAKVLSDLMAENDVYFGKTFFEVSLFLEESRIPLLDEKAQLGARQKVLNDLSSALKRGKELLEKEIVQLSAGKSAVIFLISKIRIFEHALPKDDAVSLAAEADIQKLQPFLAFLFSSESESLQGTFTAKFNEFIAREKEASEIAEISRKGIVKKEKALPSAEQAKKDFESADIKNAKLAALEDSLDWVSVADAEFDGTKFKANYNASRKIFTDIEINNEKQTQSVSLRKFPEFFSAALGKLAAPKEETKPSAEQPEKKAEGDSTLEKVLKAKAAEKLTVLGFELKEDQLTVKDLSAGLIDVKDFNIAPPESEKMIVSFEFFNETNDVQNVRFQSAVGPVVISEKMQMSQMPERVRLLMNRAKLEKEQLEKAPVPPEI